MYSEKCLPDYSFVAFQKMFDLEFPFENRTEANPAVNYLLAQEPGGPDFELNSQAPGKGLK